MKKLFLFFFAALMSAGMFGATVQEDIALDQAAWGWGYSSTVTVNNGILQCYLTGEWGAASTGWGDNRDLSGWDKIIIVVDNMNGCDGEYWKLKAYLRDSTESESNQMEGYLGLDAEDNQQNYLVIDLHQNKPCDLTVARILAIQCQPNGAVFKISRVYLEKEAAPLEPLMKTIYCKMDKAWWKADGAAVGCYTWNDGGQPKVAWPGERMTPVEGETDIWSIELDINTYHMCIFSRVNGEGDVADWGAKTSDLLIPTDENDMFTITNDDPSWGDPGCVGVWSKYEKAAPAEKPIVVFEANGNRKEVAVESFPHTFWCDLEYEDGELDLIIQQLYALPLGGYCDYFYDGPVATGNPAVTAGADVDANHFITISEAFEGTATVSGMYNKRTQMDEDIFTYTLTISIKGDEPAPTTYTLQLVADSTKGSVAVTNLLGSDIVDNGNGNYTVPANAEVTILATPLEGYEFTGWKEGNIDEMVGCYYCGTALNTNDNPMTITMTANVAYLAEFEAKTPQVERELTKLGFNFPSENIPADNDIEMAGTFEEGTMNMEKIIATGWFVSYDFVNAAEDETFKLRSKSNNDLVLCQFIPANDGEGGKWVQAIFTFGNYWSDDTWKGTPCKLIEEDLSDAAQYAWMEGMPEPLPAGIENIVLTEKAKKVIVDGMIYIVRDGKLFNLQGAQVK